MAKKMHVLVLDDGKETYIVAVFRKKPSHKKLAELEVYEGLDSIEVVHDAFDEHLSWETVPFY